MKLPTQEEINPVPQDLDGQCAVRNFLGKTREQIAREFEEHAMSYQEDLMFMGSRAFCYYFPAAVDYATASGPRVGSDIVNCLVSVIEHRLEYDSPEIVDAFPEVVRFADCVLARYDDFAPEPEIYGNLRPRLQAVRQACAEPDGAGNSHRAGQ